MILFRPLLAVSLIASFVMLMAVPAFGAPIILATVEESEPAEEEAPAPVVRYDGPAAYLEDEPVEPEEDVAQWTYQYLVPGSIVLVMLMAVALGVGYFIRVVGKRYTVVE